MASFYDPYILIDQLRVHNLIGDMAATFNNVTVTGSLTVTGSFTIASLTVTDLTVTNASIANIVSDVDMDGNSITGLASPVNPTDATNKEYVDSIAVSGLPAGTNTQVQYNNAGMFGADANFTWTKGTQVLALSGTEPALVVGSQTPDVGPALQLKTNIAAGTLMMLAGPSNLVYQTGVTTTGAVSATLLALQLANKTAAYCDVTVSAATTAGPNEGSVGFFHQRFYFKLISGTLTVSTVTTDFSIAEVSGMAVSVAGSGTVLDVGVLGTSANTHVWNCLASLVVTGAWP